MEIRTSEEVRQNVEDFANAYLEKLMEKKALDKEIKDLKDEYKEMGVAVAVVAKAINSIKAEKKQSKSEQFELEQIKEWLDTNQNVDNLLGMLIAD